MTERTTPRSVVVVGEDSGVTERLTDHADLVVAQRPSISGTDSFRSFEGIVVVDDPPEQDGIDAFERLRSEGVLPPVVVVGDAELERVERALANGVTDYVRDTDELVPRLRAHIRRPARDGFVSAARWDSIAGILAHDAKNPLNVVSGRLEFLDIEETHAEAIGRSVRRVEHMLDEVSAAASLAAPDEPGPTAVRTVAEDVWDELNTGPATLAVETDRAIDAPTEAVKLILNRLFENSLVHADNGVTVTIGDTDDGIYVADDGPGLDKAHPDRLFEQGYGMARDGDGYGLFVADHVARANGLRLSVAETNGIRFEIDHR